MSLRVISRHVLGNSPVRNYANWSGFRTNEEIARAIVKAGGTMSVSLKLLNPGTNILKRLRAVHGAGFVSGIDQTPFDFEYLVLLHRLPRSEESSAGEILSRIAASYKRFDFRVVCPFRTNPPARGRLPALSHNVGFDLESRSLKDMCGQLSEDFKNFTILSKRSLPWAKSSVTSPRFSVAKRLSIERADQMLKEAKESFREAKGYEPATAIGLSLSVDKYRAWLPRVANPRTDYMFVGEE